MTALSESIMSFAHEADMWLRSWQGSLRWKATLALGVAAAAGSLWNVAIAERIETILHKAAARHLHACTKPDKEEAIKSHNEKQYAMHLKASARVWSAFAIVFSALALFLKPEPAEQQYSRMNLELGQRHKGPMDQAGSRAKGQETTPSTSTR